MIEVTTIGLGEMGLNVVTFWMGGEVIRVSMMWFGAKARTGVTCWIGGDAIVEMIFASESVK